MSWRLVYTKQAQKDAKRLSTSKLKINAQKLLSILEEDPYHNPPRYEKLQGELEGACSRRINIQYRLIYQIYDEEKTVKVIRMWTHYER